MSAIKKFFEKGRLEMKFKKAGEGRKLTDKSASQLPKEQDKPNQSETKSSKEVSDVRKKVAEANIARLTQAKESRETSKRTNSMRAEMLAEKKEMEKAVAQVQKSDASLKGVHVEAAPVTGGVYFKCSLMGSDEALPQQEMEKRIEEFLYSQLPEEPQLTSVLIINTLNKDKNVTKACTDILTKYLTNIVENPSNESYRRIKSSNKLLNEKVLSCRGGSEFLQSVGFEKKKLKKDENAEDEFYVLDFENLDVDKLRDVLVALKEATPVEMELHRDIKVFTPTQKSTTGFHVPDSFYVVTSEEVKREQKHLEESVKGMERLMTREMREREKQQKVRRYQYAAIRVKFPDGFVIQGTFRTSEAFSSVREFVSDSLELDWIPFHLSTSTGQKIHEDEKTINELNLAPASVLQFSFDPNIVKEITQDSNLDTNRFLKDDLKMFAIEA